jgi:tRNA (uracil-5-)-methyltransferase
MLLKRFCTFAFAGYFKSFPSRQRRLLSKFSPLLDQYDALAVARMKQWREIKSRSRLPQADNVSPRQGKKRKRDQDQLEGSNEEILDFEVTALLNQQAHSATTEAGATGRASDPERFSEIELEIVELSSTGDGLALSPSGDHVYIVPFSIPGDTVLAKVVHHVKGRPYSTTDFVRVVKPSPKRNDAGIGCKYFSMCSGCQLQMLPYQDQLAHKKAIIEKAYRNFSSLEPSQVPPIEDTVGSPLQYGYRTKLTPHFDGPGRKNNQNSAKGYVEVPPIGFSLKGRSKVMDIESCPIGTDIVQLGLTRERARVARDIATFKNGATILLRETTERIPKDIKESVDAPLQHNSNSSPPSTTVIPENLYDKPTITTEFPTYIESKSYTADMNGTSVEYIDNWKFTNKAGAFFQNNNSILSPFTAYIRDRAIPPSADNSPPIKYLLDAYCGSGLFAITLSPLFLSTLGVDIAAASITSARSNALANNVTNAGFIQADASALFVDVPFPADQTLVVIDPPRKGASLNFLEQLMRFGPKRVVYVSCNVHTQARDVGVLAKGNGEWRYAIESVGGFDFFPQTGHVEGVAFLDREAVVGN